MLNIALFLSSRMYNCVSSAYRIWSTLNEAMTLAIGASYNVYRRGPKTEPCGTSFFYLTVADCFWPRRTY